MPGMERPQVDVWFRNPLNCLVQLAEVGATATTWDYGYVLTRKIKLHLMLPRFYGNQYWRALVIDNNDRFATLYDSTDPEPKAVWPVWSARYDSLTMLAKLVKFPWGESKATQDLLIENKRRPREGQAHVVVITDIPSQADNPGRQWATNLSDIQEMFPEVKLFIHGTYSSRMLFGLEFVMGDMDPLSFAMKGTVVLPNGANVRIDRLKGASYWPNLLGFHNFQLKDRDERTLFNIKSYLWAGAYYKSLKRFGIERTRGENPQLENHLKENSVIFTRRIASRAGDRVACDDCSLWLHCKYYRDGAVCAVPGSEMADIARMFGTRDSSKIVGALGKLLTVQVKRAETAVDTEDIGKEGIDPNVTKLMDSIFSNGTKLLELVDPSFRKGPLNKAELTINVPGEPQIIASPEEVQRTMASQAIDYLESCGHSRESITGEMVQTVIDHIVQVENDKKAIGTGA